MPPVVAAPLILSPVIYVAGRWMSYTARNLTLAALGFSWLLFIAALNDLNRITSPFLTFAQGTIAFYFDGLSLFVAGIVLGLSTLVVLYSGADIRGKQGEEKYYAMLLLLTGALIGLVSAGDLFNLWLWFEMTAISSYLLVAFYRDRGDALAACAKYLIQAATGSILILFGIALLFAQTGTLDLAGMQVSATPLRTVVGVLFLIGFGVKIAFVPTYTWLPDAYAQAPAGISALLSGIVTITSLIALLRVLAAFNDGAVDWGAVLIGFGTLNIVVGNLLALRQVKVKRILAYSSISQIGLISLAAGIGLYAHQYTGFQSGLLHLFNHGMMKGLAFLAVGTAAYVRFDADSSLGIDDLSGLARREPMIAFALVVACLGLVGIPPLAGFMSKWQVLAAGLQTGNRDIGLLMVFVALNSVFSLAYYLPIINALFRPEINLPSRIPPATMRLPIMILTGAVILLGVYPGVLDSLLIPAGQSLMRLFGG